jgi:hypothetical protein
VSLFEQMEEQHVGSVILINTFTVEPEEADQLQEVWASDAAFMKQQPGFISTQLHRGIGESSSPFLDGAPWPDRFCSRRFYWRRPPVGIQMTST